LIHFYKSDNVMFSVTLSELICTASMLHK